MLNELLGTKIKVIAGYPGQNEAYIAIERGELDSYGVTFWSSLTSTKQQWLRDKKINILVQYGPVKEDDLPDVPWAPDLVKNADDKRFSKPPMALLLQAGRSSCRRISRPTDLPPCARPSWIRSTTRPSNRRQGREPYRRPARSGETLQAEIARAYKVSPAIIERLRKIANP